ncbi:hypothetical protein [Cyanobacterium aponinum]|nr:hypothetical protein [Cyanobacterium aponinum]
MPSVLFYQGDRPIYEDEDLEYLEHLEYLKYERENCKTDYWFTFERFPIAWWNTEATSYCLPVEIEPEYINE